MTTIVSEIFFLLFALLVMIQASPNSAHLVQKIYFYLNTTNKQSWKLSKVKFWPKANMQNSGYTKGLNLER